MMKQDRMAYILAGWAIKDKGKWRTPSYLEKMHPKHKYGLYGCRLRVIAAYYMLQNNKIDRMITSGGCGQLSHIKNMPPIATIIKNELIELGVPASKILQEKKSNNTFEQLLELQKILSRREFSTIYIVSNKYHLPRIKAMVKYAQSLKKLAKKRNIRYISADEICLNYDLKRWQKIINKANSSQIMQKSIQQEKLGIQQIKAGTYNFKRYAN
ncbi:MAG: YdcF family protein [Candidatus Kuenenbacteria bacterium]